MQITPLKLNFTSSNLFNYNNAAGSEKPNTGETTPIEASSLDALASYNMASVDNRLPVLDIDSLDDTKLTEEFDDDELRLKDGITTYDYSYVVDYAGGYLGNQLRKMVKNNPNSDKYPEYIKEYINVIENNDNETPKEKINQELSDEEDTVIKALANAVINIRTSNPTKRQHTLYRVIADSWENQDSYEYVKKMQSLKPDEEVIVDPCPMYTSSNARQVMRTYGSQEGNKVLFKMIMPEGSNIRTLGAEDTMNRAILEPFSKFRVLDNKKYQDDINVVTLEYILPEE